MRLSIVGRGGASGTAWFAVFLILYGNVKSWILGDRASGGLPGVGMGLLLVLLTALRAHRRPPWERTSLGLECVAAKKSALAGLVAGTAIGGLILLSGALRPQLVLRGIPNSLRQLSLSSALLRMFILLPFDTAVPEELAFRGLLQAELERHFSSRVGVSIGAGVFALWHIVLTVNETQPHQWAIILLKLGGDFAGGLFFGFVRHKTGSLAGSVVAHWVIDAALMFVAVGVVRRTPASRAGEAQASPKQPAPED